MADKILRLMVVLFVGIYVARYLGPNRYGLLNFAISFVALFGAFNKLGLETIIVRNAILFPESKDELLGTAFTLRLFGGFLLIGLVFVVIQATENDSLIKLLVIIIAIGHLLEAFLVIELYFQSQVWARPSSIAGIIALCISSIIKLLLIWSKASLIWFAWVFVVEIGFRSIVLCILYIRKRLSIIKWRFRLSQAKILFKDAWPLFFSSLMIVIYMRIDQIMIKEMLDTASVGNYAVAVRLSEAWYLVPMAITQSLFPAILNTKKKSKTLFYIRMEQLYAFLLWLSVAVAIPMTLFSNWLIITLFGDVYQQAGSVLMIYVWAGIFVSLSTASGRWYVIENLQLLSLFRNFMGASVNIFLNLLLIPKFGLNGAAFATVFSYFSAAFLFDAFNHKTRIIFKMKVKSLFYPFYLFRGWLTPLVFTKYD